jgi:hypothetical protein
MVEILTDGKDLLFCFVCVCIYVYGHRENFVILCNRILLMIEMRSMSDGST